MLLWDDMIFKDIGMKKNARTIRKAGREVTQDASADRSLPEVKAILGASRGLEAEFHPAEIRGQPLSATILRERR
jgi:hypothetical protein